MNITEPIALTEVIEISQEETQPAPFVERRIKDDWVINAATLMSFTAWLVGFIVWAVLDRASPEREHVFMRIHNVAPRDYWDVAFLEIAFILLLISLGTSVIAFVFNMLRMRRKTDTLRKSIIIIAGVTIVGLVAFLMRFGAVALW
jgi:hypothetical protein